MFGYLGIELTGPSAGITSAIPALVLSPHNVERRLVESDPLEALSP